MRSKFAFHISMNLVGYYCCEWSAKCVCEYSMLAVYMRVACCQGNICNARLQVRRPWFLQCIYTKWTRFPSSGYPGRHTTTCPRQILHIVSHVHDWKKMKKTHDCDRCGTVRNGTSRYRSEPVCSGHSLHVSVTWQTDGTLFLCICTD